MIDSVKYPAGFLILQLSGKQVRTMRRYALSSPLAKNVINTRKGCAMASRFGLVRRKEGGESNPQGASDAPLTASEETRAKVEAAKAKIENMYKVQNQNIQERLSR